MHLNSLISNNRQRLNTFECVYSFQMVQLSVSRSLLGVILLWLRHVIKWFISLTHCKNSKFPLCIEALYEKQYSSEVQAICTSVYPSIIICHYDVIKWKHFPRYWPFVRRIHRSQRSQRPVTRSFDIFCAWINGWVNNREACYLRRQYDVIVIWGILNNVLSMSHCIFCPKIVKESSILYYLHIHPTEGTHLH